jgi:hypothetical protein
VIRRVLRDLLDEGLVVESMDGVEFRLLRDLVMQTSDFAVRLSGHSGGHP